MKNPSFIVAKFNGVCPETGLPIKKGDTIVYFPKEKIAYHATSKNAEMVRGADFSKTWGMMDKDY